MAINSGIWQNIYNYLEKSLTEAENGQWEEITPEGCHTCPMNPNIEYCFTTMGFSRDQLDNAGRDKDTGKYKICGDMTPWCAAFVGTVLKNCGAPYLQNNLAAIAYAKYNTRWKAKRIGKKNYDEWRQLDVIVKRSGDYNHVGFLRRIDLKNDRYELCGGNQDNTVNNCVYADLSKIYGAFRAWEVPSYADKSVIVDNLPDPGPQNTR